MSWFFELKKRESAKNGSIIASRFFGVWTVTVNGCEQTGPEVHRMWIDAFRKIKRRFPEKKIQRVVALGLGGGGEISTILNAFSGADLTILEYDPEMIALTKELQLYKPFSLPRIIEGDARETLPTLASGFDLVIVDLFHGEDPSPLIMEGAFLDSLYRALSPRGLLLVNVFKHLEYLEHVSKPLKEPSSRFLWVAQWTFHWNNFGLFQKEP